MRIAHLADIHIRKSPTRHPEYRGVFNNLYKSLRKQKPDRIVLVGDLVHDYIDLQGEAVVLASEFLNELAKIAPVIITRGNHDIRKKAPNRTDSIEAIVLAIANKRVLYLNETGFYDDDDIGVTWAVWKHGERNNSPWRKRSKTYNKDNIIIDLFHDPVRGCKTATGFEMNQKTYINNRDLKGDFSFLGDIHKLQYLDKEKTIAYPSSLIAQNFGEGDGKFHGYLLWEFTKGMGGQTEATSKEISIKNDYAYVTVTLNTFTDFDDLDFDIDNTAKYNNIRIKWQTLPEKNNEVNKRRVVEYINEYVKENKQEIKTITHKADYIEEDVIDQIDEDLDMDNIVLQEVQHEIFDEYLKKIGVEEDYIEKVIELDDEIADKIEIDDFTNIQWEILKLKGTNFMSYEDVEIDWRKQDGLFQITGINTAGKTTLMKLITYILYNKAKETESRKKAGDSRFVNNRNGALFCEGELVMEINGEYYGVRRRTDIQKNKAGEVISAPTMLSYYKLNDPDEAFDDDVNHIDSFNDKDRIQTQKVIERAIGGYDNFMRVVMTTSDTLNDILSNERAKFIDALLYDSGLDIFDVKLKEFKEYQKKINALPRITCNIETTKEKIEQLEKDIVTLNEQVDNLEQNELPTLKKTIYKGELWVEKLTKKLNKIDEDVYNLDVDKVDEEIKSYNEQIDLVNKKSERLTRGIAELAETFDNDKLIALKEESSNIVKKINGLKVNIKEEERKVLELEHEKSVLNGDVVRLKERGVDVKQAITDVKASRNCPTCGQKLGEEHQKHIDESIKKMEDEMYNDIAPAIKEKLSQIPPIDESITNINTVEIAKMERDIDTLNEEGAKISEEIGELENLRQDVEKRKQLQTELNALPTEIQNYELKINILNKNIELYEKSKKQIEENQKIEGGITKAKQRLKELVFEQDQLKDLIYAKNTQRAENVKIIKDLESTIELYKEQEKQDSILEIYKKCIHRDGIPTQLLVNKAIPKINEELSLLLDNVPFSVWLDAEDLRLKLAYNNRMGAVIDAISSSGKERTFSAIALKFALNQINAKSKPTIFLLDEVMGKLTEDSVEEFVMVLHAIKERMKKVLVVEHNHEIEPDYLLEVTLDENDISQLKVN